MRSPLIDVEQTKEFPAFKTIGSFSIELEVANDEWMKGTWGIMGLKAGKF